MKHALQIFLVFVIIITIYADEDVFMIGKNFCLTNSTSAMYLDSPSDELYKESSIYPSPPYSRITCNSAATRCDRDWDQTNWARIHSFKTNQLEIITDRRWESFPTIATPLTTDRKTYFYKEVMDIEDGMSIAFSVKADVEAHIFLCESKTRSATTPDTSNCYWIMLGGKTGYQSAIRKCASKEIPRLLKKYSSGSCSENHSEKQENPLDGSNWKHFIIQKWLNLLKVHKGEEIGNKNTFMEFDDDDPIIPAKLFVHYKGKKQALWKFHSYYYFKSSDRGLLTSPVFNPKNNKICVSMFVKTSSQNQLEIDIKTRRSSEASIQTAITTDGLWDEIKVFSDVDGVSYTINLVCSSRYFTDYRCAVDGVRECSETEYRYLSADTDDLDCRLLEDKKTLYFRNKDNTVNRELDCPETTFGKTCIPCKIFGKDFCGSFKYCELSDSGKECFCTAGYQNDQCEVCPERFYGHGCHKISHCTRKYDKTNGVCEIWAGQICEDPYYGISCQNVYYPFFLYPPTVNSVNAIGFIVVQENLTKEGNADYYHFEYSEADQENWKIIGTDIRVNISQPVEVLNDDFYIIKPDTEYKVRAVLKDQSRSIQESKSLNFKRIVTQCKELTEDRILITATDTEAQVTIDFPLESCKLEYYQISLDGSLYKNLKLDYQNHLGESNLVGLKPFTQYTLYVKYSSKNRKIPVITKTFNTRQGEPSEITNFQFTTSPTEIKLSWHKPEKENGIVSGYRISYRVNRRLACIEMEDSPFDNVTTEYLKLTLEWLQPYTQYVVHIRAVTNETQGKNFMIPIQTLPLSSISEEEGKLSIQNLAPETNGAIISISYLKCSSVFGPLTLRFEFICLSDWCKNDPQINLTRNFKSDLTMAINHPSILPFTNYTMNFKVERDSMNWKLCNSFNFRTAPGVPSKILNVEKYNNSETSISLRWKPPYPPTGVLESYVIIYNFAQQDVNVKECSLWKGYHCATIDRRIVFNSKYVINVAAKNIDTTYGEYSNNITVEIKRQGPSKVYNIHAEWRDNDELDVSFYHPNNTNGKLESFEIWVNQSMQPYERPTEYMLVYHYLVPVPSVAYCKNLTIAVQAHNSYAQSGYETKVVDTPPPQPNEIEKIDGTSTNTTITLEIQIEKKNGRVDTCSIFISGTNQTTFNIVEEFLKFSPENNLKLVYTTSAVDTNIEVVIGKNDNAINTPLNPGTNYSIIVTVANTCNNITRIKMKQIFIQTMGVLVVPVDVTTAEPFTPGVSESVSINGLWALLLLIVLPIILVWYIKKKHPHIPQMIKPQTKPPPEDQIILTDTPPMNKPNVKTLKPKPSIIIPAPKTKNSKKVKIIDLEKYVKESIADGELQKQHDLFPKGLLKPHSVGSTPENKAKNRYKNLVAYDHSRVKLKRPAGDNQSDYINANYIDGYRKPKAYIATQGPKPTTLTDFWMMVWQKNVREIIMLANIYENGKKKVEKYWPDINEDKLYGDYKVRYISSSVYANFEERLFSLSHNNEERKVTQLHFTTWPDHGVPLYSQSLVPFLQKILKIPYNPQSPMIVHCSAGVGRTGTIILSDIILRMAAAENSVDFLAYLEIIRDQRSNLVDNLEQYKLSHLVVLECLFGMRTSIMCNDDMRTIVENTISNNGIKTQMKYIQETQWQDSAMETMLDNEEVSPIFEEKNRFKDIIPEHYRVYVTRYPHEDETSSYINAILVDDFRNPGRYIVTQQPMPNTIGDFWRMVLERGSTVIISLNTIDLKDETVCRVWPEKNEELNPVDFIKIVHKKTRRLEFYSIVTVELVTQLTEVENTTVNIIALDNWRHEDLLPNSIEEFLAFKDAAEALSRTSENIVVMCYDGAKASGLYLALSFIIEKMKLEQECDVCLAVRTVRHSRKQFLTTEEQYEFLYRASLTFITGFQPYSNFA